MEGDGQRRGRGYLPARALARGDLTQERLELAAYCGHEGARQALAAVLPPVEMTERLNALVGWGPEVALRTCVAATAGLRLKLGSPHARLAAVHAAIECRLAEDLPLLDGLDIEECTTELTQAFAMGVAEPAGSILMLVLRCARSSSEANHNECADWASVVLDHVSAHEALSTTWSWVSAALVDWTLSGKGRPQAY